MAYFAPYIDGTGIHMPTYEDRLEDLCGAYRTIFGMEAELSPAVPDYQLLSVLARALDDVSALTVQAYNSRNPAYAAGSALDLLLPQYGITRAAGETDAEARERIRHALAGKSRGTADALEAALKGLESVWDARVYVNDTGSTDSRGIPGHAIGVVTENSPTDRVRQAIAQTIFDKKPPGIGTWGSTTVNAADAQGNTHPVSFTQYTDKMVFAYVYIRVLEGGDRETIRNALTGPLAEAINSLGLAVPLNVPQLYGTAYSARPEIAKTFVVSDIQIAVTGSSSTIRDIVPCAWNEKITTVQNGGILFYFS